VKTLSDLQGIPLRASSEKQGTRLDMVSGIRKIKSPTEVDHYEIRRTIDIFVRPLNEDLARIANAIDGLSLRRRFRKG